MKGCKHLIRSLAALAVLNIGLMQGALAAKVTLDDIDFTALPGNEFEIKLDFSGEPPQPATYTIDKPARIVLDLPEVESTLEKKKHPMAFENAKSAVVLTAGGKTRVVINLNNMTSYNAERQGNSILVSVGSDERGIDAGPGDDTSSVEEAVTAERDDNVEGRAITDVDFSRGAEDEGLVKLTLSDPNINVDVEQKGTRILLDFYNTDLPDRLDRRLDVIDFATPVKTIDTTTEGSTTRVEIDAEGQYDYMAYQADKDYVVSVKPLTPEEAEERQSKFDFVGEKLSLNFQDIEVRSVLQLIADFTDLNLVASDTVKGNITLRLNNVPWDQALDIVLKAKGLDKRLEGNVLLVAPAEEIAERERLQVEAEKQLQELAPLVTEFIRIKYADAKELFDLFDVEDNGDGGGDDDGRTATRSMLSDRGSAIVDERTNTIILTDTEEKVMEFRRLVDKLDIPIRQVEIAARVVVATTDFRRELGVKWGIAALKESGGDLFTVAGNRQGQSEGGVVDYFTIDNSEIDDEGNVENTHDLSLDETLALDLGASGAEGGPAGSISLGFLSQDIILDLELSALENAGYGEIASQPKVLTGDKQKASIKSGQEIAYQEATSSGATNVEFKEAALTLEVTPQITPDNRVILDLNVTQDNVADEVFGGVPALDITRIETKALVGDGQTLVIGGIYQYQNLDDTAKVPFLGDIPYMGRLFRNDFRSTEKREILIFVTPKIIDDQLLDR